MQRDGGHNACFGIRGCGDVGSPYVSTCIQGSPRGCDCEIISVCAMASVVPPSMQLQIVTIQTMPNSSAFPFKANSFTPISKSIWRFVLIISAMHAGKGAATALPRDLFEAVEDEMHPILLSTVASPKRQLLPLCGEN